MNQPVHKSSYAIASLVLLAVLLVSTLSVSNSALQGLRVDLTENNLYTLSEGTRDILKDVGEPIDLYFFYTPEAAQGIPTITNYAQRVREMLEEFAQVAGGTLKLHVINPEPFSEAEDRAVELGIQAVPLGTGDNLYFGLAASSTVGKTAVIPYFSPTGESSLEYDLSKLIFEVSRTDKPVVGVLSTLDVAGGFDMRSQQPLPPWQITEQLQRFFTVEVLDEDFTRVPENIDLLMLVHPAGLKPATGYAIDQFVLGGGRALVFVDPYAMMAPLATDPADPQATVPTGSSLNELFGAWGVEFSADQIVTDSRYAMQMATQPGQPPSYHYGVLSLSPPAMNQQDITTQGLESVNLALAGSLKPAKNASTEFTPLFTSSEQSMPTPAARVEALQAPDLLQRGFQPTGDSYVLAARIRGSAKTAFPDGPPKRDESANTEDADSSQPKDQITESAAPINVIVVADTDLLTDRLWVQVDNFFGRQIATPWASNGDFTINAVDNLLGSSALIGIRSRQTYARPFQVVEDLRRTAEQRYRATEEQLQARLQETERKLSELQSQKTEGSPLILSDAQRQAIERFEQDKLEIRQELRAVRHQLNKDIEQLGTTLKIINIVLVPLLFVIIAIALRVLWRRRAGEEQLYAGGAA
jgi:ABC-type uncharacterized transport system involved in gliding motility auxiliary subunit